MDEEDKKLIISHWLYIERLLEAHGTPKVDIMMCEFHYKTAFEHGMKHQREKDEIKKRR